MTKPLWLVAAGLCLWATTAGAQVPTGTISGRVVDEKGGVMPGVTVTATSPNLQGPRAAVTSENGDYSIPLLPPGDYTVTFELMGFRTARKTVAVGATQQVPLDAELTLSELSETVEVTGELSAFLETAQVATRVRQELMQTLPSNRTLTASVLMAPNVRATGPTSTNGGDGAIVVSGAMSFDSVYMINGVAITENLRGQPTTLFIEDAIQETTVSTGGISAEYGRFGGGLVNVITKSGGNDFSGSFRLSMNNDNWRARTPFGGAKLDDTVPTYEYTLGGPVVRDRLWFFNAGRFRDLGESRATNATNIAYVRGEDEKRYEAKLTYTIRSGQTVKGSYSHVDQIITNNNFQNVMDLKSLYNQEQPQRLLSLNYNGLVGSSLAVEGQFSRRTLSFLTSGAAGQDLINDTLLIDRARGGTGFRYWAPTFCTCNIDERNNYELLFKGSYFLSTRGSGAHSIVFGYNHYDDQRTTENHQSGSDYRILGTSTATGPDGSLVPVFQNTGVNNSRTLIQQDPITLESRGSDIRTHAFFVNDAWRFNSGVSLNLGLRWDKNHGRDGAGDLIASGNRLSPRLGVAWDPLNDGRWSITGSFARYVSGLNNGVVDVSPAGQPATYQWVYDGPPINVGAVTMTTPEALQTLFNWFFANGGTNRVPVSASVPGVNTFIGDDLNSPYAWEYAGGVSRTIGPRGSVRADYVFRDYKDFYSTVTNLSTGQATSPTGAVFDINLIENTSDLKRKYQGGTFQATYRLSDSLTAGSAYTLSRTWGNYDGENPASGPLTAQLFSYPEYRQASWNAPEGNLGSDQRHRARIWGTYRVPMTSNAGTIDIGLLHTVASGIPYTTGGAPPAPGTGVATIDPTAFVTNPGYANPLSSAGGAVEYYFFERDRFRTETQNRTDLSLNYARRILGGAEVFFHGEVLNIFNIYQLCACGGTVFNNGGGSDMRQINNQVQVIQNFNPFTTTPVEGTHWRLGPLFGQPTSRFAYTSPRTFRFNFGVRF
jgi:hypothetical protein